MKITVQNFVQEFKDKKIANTKIAPDAISRYIREKLDIKNYIPFREKRIIAETIIAKNIKETNGIKQYDNIDGYIGLVIASITAHTNIEWSADPVADYDLLAESGLLSQIIAEFKSSHDEIDILLKMALASELEDNNINAVVARFLDDILKRLDGVGEALKSQLGNINIKDILGADFNKEDLAKLTGFLNKYNK